MKAVSDSTLCRTRVSVSDSWLLGQNIAILAHVSACECFCCVVHHVTNTSITNSLLQGIAFLRTQRQCSMLQAPLLPARLCLLHKLVSTCTNEVSSASMRKRRMVKLVAKPRAVCSSMRMMSCKLLRTHTILTWSSFCENQLFTSNLGCLARHTPSPIPAYSKNWIVCGLSVDFASTSCRGLYRPVWLVSFVVQVAYVIKCYEM